MWKFNGVSIPVHRALINFRCPELLDRELKISAIDAATGEAFIKFLYSDRVEDQCSSDIILGVAYLLDKFEFAAASRHCLIHLQHSQFTGAELVPLYVKCLALRPFKLGLEVCRFLLQKHREEVDKMALVTALKDDPEILAETIQILSSSGGAVAPLAPTEPTRGLDEEGNPIRKTLQDALARLYKSKKGADFTIGIRNIPDFKIQCHSFVLYARWSYFRRLIDVGMREAAEKVLLLPGHEEDAGLHHEFVEAIVAACYSREYKLQLTTTLSTAAVLEFVGNSDLYLGQPRGYLDSDNPFCHLVGAAEDSLHSKINPENCMELLTAAASFNAISITNRTISYIADHSRLYPDPSWMVQIQSLPWHLQISIFWHSMGLTGECPPVLHSAGTDSDNVHSTRRIVSLILRTMGSARKVHAACEQLSKLVQASEAAKEALFACRKDWLRPLVFYPSMAVQKITEDIIGHLCNIPTEAHPRSALILSDLLGFVPVLKIYAHTRVSNKWLCGIQIWAALVRKLLPNDDNAVAALVIPRWPQLLEALAWFEDPWHRIKTDASKMNLLLLLARFVRLPGMSDAMLASLQHPKQREQLLLLLNPYLSRHDLQRENIKSFLEPMLGSWLGVMECLCSKSDEFASLMLSTQNIMTTANQAILEPWEIRLHSLTKLNRVLASKNANWALSQLALFHEQWPSQYPLAQLRALSGILSLLFHDETCRHSIQLVNVATQALINFDSTDVSRVNSATRLGCMNACRVLERISGALWNPQTASASDEQKQLFLSIIQAKDAAKHIALVACRAVYDLEASCGHVIDSSLRLLDVICSNGPQLISSALRGFKSYLNDKALNPTKIFAGFKRTREKLAAKPDTGKRFASNCNALFARLFCQVAANGNADELKEMVEVACELLLRALDDRNCEFVRQLEENLLKMLDHNDNTWIQSRSSRELFVALLFAHPDPSNSALTKRLRTICDQTAPQASELSEIFAKAISRWFGVPDEGFDRIEQAVRMLLDMNPQTAANFLSEETAAHLMSLPEDRSLSRLYPQLLDHVKNFWTPPQPPAKATQERTDDSLVPPPAKRQKTTETDEMDTS
eukprot:TRINITY_DN15258_c0_g1_i1.p1 TRINITY_DN15258_c0_g1~~TRINITY_DN15258_c0_g1_i1.p1  ORF type:complete len:1085 (-),score=115.26 TRINITY_DN15258_c0_g1_i1:107-3361(-)